MADRHAQMHELEVARKKKRFQHALQSHKLRIRQLRQNEIFAFERSHHSALCLARGHCLSAVSTTDALSPTQNYERRNGRLQGAEAYLS